VVLQAVVRIGSCRLDEGTGEQLHAYSYLSKLKHDLGSTPHRLSKQPIAPIFYVFNRSADRKRIEVSMLLEA
jgi:hypothetical protein